jgi:glycosyltransferase involved in cell wall biosynthesis
MDSINEKLKETPTVTIIIPSYNSCKTISMTISGIKEQTRYDSIKEIIIVDSSDDNVTPDLLNKMEDDIIKSIRSGTKVMPAIQRNIGAAMASGDILCFVDSDAFPAPNWIELIINEYSKGYLAGGGSYQVPEFQKDKPIVFAQYFVEFSKFIGYGKRGYRIMIPSCNLFCDRLLFNRVDGFPIIRAAEDGFFGQKLNQFVRMIYIPEAKVYHIFRENENHVMNNLRMLGKFAYYYRRENYNNFIYTNGFNYIFLPAFLSFRLLRIFYRVLRTNKNNIKQFFKASPIIIKGSLSWGKGFLQGVREYNKDMNKSTLI